MAPASKVTVEERPDGAFDVEVRTGHTVTTHRVSVPRGYPVALGCAHVPEGELVAALFDFLLEREPSTSILRRFTLADIERYFPEYPEEIGHRLAG